MGCGGGKHGAPGAPCGPDSVGGDTGHDPAGTQRLLGPDGDEHHGWLVVATILTSCFCRRSMRLGSERRVGHRAGLPRRRVS